jgi:predicted secreted hydrolase
MPGLPASFCRLRCLGLIIFCLLLAERGAGAGDYLPVKAPCGLTFPRDHGAHPGYRTEWWYYMGNVVGPAQDRYGFQLTFFRVQMAPNAARKGWPPHPSAWRTDQLYLAHAALSCIKDGTFSYDEQMARGALGMAGVEQKAGITRIFVGTWSAQLGPEGHHLVARTDPFSLDLSLMPLGPPVPHGRNGYSLKGRSPESASCYYSVTRLKASGNVTVGGRNVTVSGMAWMDHEFSSAPLEADLTGWDWFSLQLSDQTELMIYLLREEKGGYSGASSGTFVGESGKGAHLSREEFQVEVLDHWKSPHSGASYPSRWRVRVPSLGLDLLVTPNLADQELNTSRSTGITYWEGSVSARGRAGERPVDGVGYVEMTGYAKPFNLTAPGP